MASSSVSAASLAAVLEPALLCELPLVRTASTRTGCRCPQRAPAQYAASSSTPHPMISRVKLEFLRASMFVILPGQPNTRNSHSIEPPETFEVVLELEGYIVTPWRS